MERLDLLIANKEKAITELNCDPEVWQNRKGLTVSENHTLLTQWMNLRKELVELKCIRREHHQAVKTASRNILKGYDIYVGKSVESETASFFRGRPVHMVVNTEDLKQALSDNNEHARDVLLCDVKASEEKAHQEVPFYNVWSLGSPSDTSYSAAYRYDSPYLNVEHDEDGNLTKAWVLSGNIAILLRDSLGQCVVTEVQPDLSNWDGEDELLKPRPHYLVDVSKLSLTPGLREIHALRETLETQHEPFWLDNLKYKQTEENSFEIGQ